MGGWKWVGFAYLLCLGVLLPVASIPAPSDNIPDILVWTTTGDGHLTVKSVCEFIIRGDGQTPKVLWTMIWEWEGPQRVPTFLWLVGHQPLLTNALQCDTELTSSDLCSICNRARETTLHVLRDCPLIKEVWRQLVPGCRQWSFFSMELNEWRLMALLSTDFNKEGLVSWATIFGIGCWLAWMCWNNNIFAPNIPCPSDKVGVIRGTTEAYTRVLAYYGSSTNMQQIRQWRDVGWCNPLGGWYCLNTDGTRKKNPRFAGAGGLIRDSDGRWVGWFVNNVRIATLVVAELWSLEMVLSLHGAKRKEINPTSWFPIGLLKSFVEGKYTRWLLPLMQQIRDLLDRDWQVEIRHMYRDGNRCGELLLPEATERAGAASERLGRLDASLWRRWQIT